ncbi:MAG: hypothetical protein WED04_00770 [Promethearchaeati archaeon SRVP18_Atabeyarchaeia-1]
MGSTVNIIAGFAVSLGLAWGLLLFGELPSEVVPATFAQTILSTQYTWVAKIWFLVHHVLLDAQLELSSIQLLVLGVVPWLVGGITVGMLSRNASKGFGTGLFSAILSVVIGWLVLFLSPFLGIALPGDGLITMWMNNPLQYLASLLSFQAVALCVVSGVGGALGGILTHIKR